MTQRKTLIYVDTPYPGAQTVVLHEQTWDFHFSQLRRDLGKEALIDTLERPEHVLEGTTNPNYVVFVNTRVLSDNSANPLVVIVDPDAQPTPAVASFGHRRDFKDISKHRVLWVPAQNDEESSD